MWKRLHAVPTILMMCLTTGCGTMVNVRGDDSPRWLYGGTEMDLAVASSCTATNLHLFPETEAQRGYACFVFGCLALADVPFCLVADTLTLPITIPATLQRLSEAQLKEASKPQPAEPLPHDDCYQEPLGGPAPDD